jgi:hypothetical protein
MVRNWRLYNLDPRARRRFLENGNKYFHHPTSPACPRWHFKRLAKHRRLQGGGIQPGYEAELRFDGKTYPENPSTPPAMHSPENARGEILIASTEGAVFLY